MSAPTLVKASAVAIILAWLALYLSSYGVLVRSTTTAPSEAAHGLLSGPSTNDTLQCTYFIATGFHTVEYWYSMRQVCPRMQYYGG
jgi:hypothetical protein